MSLPDAVRIREVGPRDGFQNEPETIPTATKLELIAQLARTGVPRIELTSFVRADVIPQLADAVEVLRRADVPAGVERSVIVPNSRGLDLALEHAPLIDDVNVFLSASESHNQRNVNRSVAASLRDLEGMIGRVRDAGLRPRATISTAFGCPYEGPVPADRVVEIATALADVGAEEVGLGDTTGMANPLQSERLIAALRDRTGERVELTAHFHNTRGQGLANVLGALHGGCTSFDASFGELGGCPVPVGATGNIATEDLVSMLDEMEIATGVALDRVIAAGLAVQSALGRTLASRTLVAGPIEWNPRPASPIG